MTSSGRKLQAQRVVGPSQVVQVCFKVASERGFWWLLIVRAKPSRSS